MTEDEAAELQGELDAIQKAMQASVTQRALIDQKLAALIEKADLLFADE
jgi:hypothetical protein